MSIAFCVVTTILVWLRNTPVTARLQNIALCLILGGALGNLWDRLVYGYVIDFISFFLGNWHFAIFNIADSAITVGTVLLIIDWLYTKK